MVLNFLNKQILLKLKITLMNLQFAFSMYLQTMFKTFWTSITRCHGWNERIEGLFRPVKYLRVRIYDPAMLLLKKETNKLTHKQWISATTYYIWKNTLENLFLHFFLPCNIPDSLLNYLFLLNSHSIANLTLLALVQTSHQQTCVIPTNSQLIWNFTSSLSSVNFYSNSKDLSFSKVVALMDAGQYLMLLWPLVEKRPRPMNFFFSWGNWNRKGTFCFAISFKTISSHAFRWW